jgi:uncharacterized membrane protein
MKPVLQHPTEDDELSQSNGLGRVLALSDGVFAIAITLLVFNLTIRPGLSSSGISKTLRHLAPQFQSAAISFIVIGLLWIGHHRMFSYIKRVDRVLLQLNLLSLAPVIFMPFAAQLLSEYGDHSEGSVVYASTITIASLLFLLLWWYAVRIGRLTTQTLDRRTVVRCAFRQFVTFIVFGLSIPIALVSPTGAHLVWLALLIVVLLAPDSLLSGSQRMWIRQRGQRVA